ncbi:response regulator [Roseinatronobacter sp.]
MSLQKNDFFSYIDHNTNIDTNGISGKGESVLIVSPSCDIFESFSQLLEAIGVHVEQVSIGEDAIEKVKKLRPKGIIIDLDFDDNIGFDLLYAFSPIKNKMAFLAATSSQVELDDESKHFGADIFFAKNSKSITHIQCFLISIFLDRTQHSAQLKPCQVTKVGQVAEYEYAHELMRQADSDEDREYAIRVIEKLGRKAGDPVLLRAKNFARQTGSTVQLSAYFNAYMKRNSSEDLYSKITLLKQ